jgi:cytoskeletal protein RodZ
LARRIVKEFDAILLAPDHYIDDISEERVRTVKRKINTVNTMETEAGVRISAGENMMTLTGEGTVVEDTECKMSTKHSSADNIEVLRTVVQVKVTQKIRQRQRSNFSAAVAKVAYNKFGERPMSPANVLVTRKWLQKYLEDSFKDLRTADKNVAIDRALFLSFVPTKDFLQMRIVMETAAIKERMTGSSWFGRVFQLATTSVNSEMVTPL